MQPEFLFPDIFSIYFDQCSKPQHPTFFGSFHSQWTLVRSPARSSCCCHCCSGSGTVGTCGAGGGTHDVSGAVRHRSWRWGCWGCWGWWIWDPICLMKFVEDITLIIMRMEDISVPESVNLKQFYEWCMKGVNTSELRKLSDTARWLSSDSIRSKESWLPGISFWRGAQRTARYSRHWSGGFCVLEKVERLKTHYHHWFKNQELDAVELVVLSCILWILWVCDASMSINPLGNLARCLWTLQCHGGPGGAFHTFSDSAKCLVSKHWCNPALDEWFYSPTLLLPFDKR